MPSTDVVVGVAIAAEDVEEIGHRKEIDHQSVGN